MPSTQQSSSPLRIAVVGVGGIGSAFAFQLAETGGHEVTAVARPGSPRWQQLTRDQAIVKATGERVAVHVADALDEAIPYDLIVVTLLAHQVASVLPQLQRSPARRIQLMFNNFEPETIRDAIGADRSAFGMPFIQASLDPDGKLNAKIGAGGQKTKIGTQDYVDIFNKAGLPVVLEPDMLLWLRCHAPLAVAFESVSVAGVRRGGAASWAESMVIAGGLQESFTLIERLGYHLYPSGKSLLHRLPVSAVALFLQSMSRIRPFRELLATGENECRALADAIVARAPQANPPVTVSRIAAMKPSIVAANQ